MKESNYWEHFAQTGKIEDYLSFKSCDQENGQEKSEDKTYAGYCDSDGNRAYVGAYRGI